MNNFFDLHCKDIEKKAKNQIFQKYFFKNISSSVSSTAKMPILIVHWCALSHLWSTSAWH